MGIDGMVREVLRSEPQAPRRVRYRDVISILFRSSLGLAVFIGAVPGLIAGAGFIAWAHGQVVAVILGISFLVFACFVSAIPFVYAARLRRALGSGVQVNATVQSLERADGPNRRTMDAMVNGFATGIRRVHHSLGDFDDRFRYDGRGAARLRIGSVMSVLVDPARQRVLLDVTSAQNGAAQEATPSN